jgi:sec-independent protein translocase protein TatA
MFGDIGLPELAIILVILLLIFGPSRLGDLGSSLGKGLKGFRRAMRETDDIDSEHSDEKLTDGNILEASSKNPNKIETK